MRLSGIAAVSLLLSLSLTSMSSAQPPDASAELKRLAFLVGEWEGNGWVTMGPSGRHEVSIRETARWAAGGTVLVLDGLGVERRADGTERPVHQAFAVISWDPTASHFRIRAYRADGGEVEDNPVVTEQVVVWGFRDPQAGQVRFTLRLDNDTWHEVGEFSRDGSNWQQFMEMRLRRK
jgi:hypothetical protein